ncbi:MAG: MASE1 domain-containing protein [Burkholderiales bacterium]|nr:MASE1 domain-containing protein [Burkholderiales bacterium]
MATLLSTQFPPPSAEVAVPFSAARFGNLWQRWGAIALFGAIYGLMAKVGLNYSSVASNVTLIWAPSGIALFVILRYGYGFWPGIVIGDLLGNAGTGAPLLSVLGISTGNILETLGVVWLLHRHLDFHPALDRARDAVALLALGTAGAAVSAIIGPASLVLGGAFPADIYWTVWLQWLMGDAAGVVVLTPLLLALHVKPAPLESRARWMEAGVLTVALLVVCEIVFGGFDLVRQGYYPASLAIFPLAVWAAMRFGLRGATRVTLVVSVAAVWGTVEGRGPFAEAAAVDSLVRWWVFANVITITGLLLAASRAERTRAQAQLQRERDFVESVLDAEDALVVVLDPAGRIARVNRALERSTGQPADRLAGGAFVTHLLAPPHWPKFDANLELLRVNVSNAVRFEGELIDSHGRSRIVSWSLAALRGPHRRIEHLIATGLDITERTQAATALRQSRRELERRVAERTRALADSNAELEREIVERQRLESEIITVSEREQMRFGQELHDGLGQHLTATAFLSELLARQLESRGLPEAADAARIQQMVSEAVSQTRQLARGLFPVELEADGLMAALELLSTSATRAYGIDCRLDCPAPVLVRDNTIAVNLYRIAQEAVNNAAKHAVASRIVVGLDAGSGALRLAVRDDGVGLDATAGSTDGMGLAIMRHRARLIGASLELTVGTDDRGTAVQVTLPLAPPLPETRHDA